MKFNLLILLIAATSAIRLHGGPDNAEDEKPFVPPTPPAPEPPKEGKKTPK